MNKRAILNVLIVGIMFTLGFFTSSVYSDINKQSPTTFNNSDNRTDIVASPSDWVKESQILVYDSQVLLNIKNAEWASFTDTHSMEPVLSARANAIEIVPASEDDVKVGDIVSYKSDYADGIIIHRVIDKSYDSQGTYFILKGDNNPTADPGRIRFSQIQRVVVAIIY